MHTNPPPHKRSGQIFHDALGLAHTNGTTGIGILPVALRQRRRREAVPIDPPDESSKSAAGTATAKSQRASLRHKLRWCLSIRRTLRSATNPIVKIAISAMLW